jgi:hypothetical protein
VMFLVATAARAQETVQLKWALEKGAKRILKTESVTRTITDTTDQNGLRDRKEETATQTAEMALEVVGVAPNGNLTIVAQPQSIKTESKSKAESMTFTATRAADGAITTDAQVESDNPMLKGAEVKTLLKTVAANMLKLKSTFEVTPLGAIASVKVEGDPFKDLPEDTQMNKLIGKMLRKMISADDLAKVMSAEAFTQLPDKPVKVNDTWPVKRSFTLMGLEMTGTGTATLAGVQDKKATIREAIKYTVDTKKYCAMVKDLVESVVADLGLSIKVEVNLQTTGNIAADSTSAFDTAAGATTLTEWQEMKIPFGGTMVVASAGRENRVKMDISVSTSTKATWQ